MNDTVSASTDAIVADIVDYVLNHHQSDFTGETLPRDQSLLELGVLDSFGIVELVEFLESHWKIAILDDEITMEKMGSIHKMTSLIQSKIGE